MWQQFRLTVQARFVQNFRAEIRQPKALLSVSNPKFLSGWFLTCLRLKRLGLRVYYICSNKAIQLENQTQTYKTASTPTLSRL